MQTRNPQPAEPSSDAFPVTDLPRFSAPLRWLLGGPACGVALMLAALFAWRLGRPIANLGRAIHRLGDGDITSPIAVHGPSDIARLGVQLDWLRNRLVELQTARRTLLQSVSHDLKTPLAAITEGRALLAEGVAGAVSRDQQALLDLIALNAERLLARINALVEAGARMQARGVATRVAMSTVVEDVLAEHAFVCATRRLRVQADLEAIDVHGDREQLRMIVDNLVSNAIKYSPDGGAILFVALFLLGVGWNLGFVAGSALLTEGLNGTERTTLQGATDAMIWSSAAAAALGSGIVVAAASYTALGLLGAALIALPAAAMLRGRAALRRS